MSTESVHNFTTADAVTVAPSTTLTTASRLPRANKKSTDNGFKTKYAIQAVVSSLIIVSVAGRVSVNFLLAMGICLAFQLWNFFFVNILILSPNIYDVRAPTAIVSDWIQLSIPSTVHSVELRKDRVVTSISELAGVRGSHIMIVTRVLTAILTTIILSVIQQDLHHRKTMFLNIQSGTDLVPVCMLTMALGLFFTSHFELNKMDWYHTKGHYLGLSGIFLGSFSLGFVTQWSTLSIGLIITEFTLCAIWVTCVIMVPKKSDNLNKVSRISKLCIGIEVTMLHVTSIILMLTVYGNGANEGNIWSSPYIISPEN